MQHVEPKREGLEDDVPIEIGDFQVPVVSFFRVCFTAGPLIKLGKASTFIREVVSSACII